jgi:hypothetical protein
MSFMKHYPGSCEARSRILAEPPESRQKASNIRNVQRRIRRRSKSNRSIVAPDPERPMQYRFSFSHHSSALSPQYSIYIYTTPPARSSSLSTPASQHLTLGDLLDQPHMDVPERLVSANLFEDANKALHASMGNRPTKAELRMNRAGC